MNFVIQPTENVFCNTAEGTCLLMDFPEGWSQMCFFLFDSDIPTD